MALLDLWKKKDTWHSFSAVIFQTQLFGIPGYKYHVASYMALLDWIENT